VNYGFSKDIILDRSITRLWILSAHLVLQPPLLLPMIFSTGDIVIAMGIFLMLANPDLAKVK
jgi:hypothetical protein